MITSLSYWIIDFHVLHFSPYPFHLTIAQSIDWRSQVEKAAPEKLTETGVFLDDKQAAVLYFFPQTTDAWRKETSSYLTVGGRKDVTSPLRSVIRITVDRVLYRLWLLIKREFLRCLFWGDGQVLAAFITELRRRWKPQGIWSQICGRIQSGTWPHRDY